MQLITERLVLRECVTYDWPTVLSYQREPRYLRYYPETGRTKEYVQQLVHMFMEQQVEWSPRKFQLPLTLRGGRPAIGSVGIRRKPYNE